ncbi:MAG TPA: hypothetical protein ENI61_05325 [Ignavibacteria bacterium]|nr:hypothetical protein [Ignavibacteria bacterium]
MSDKQKQLERRNTTEAGKIERELYPLRIAGLYEWKSIFELDQELNKLKPILIVPMDQNRYILG